ncbi:MAG TPA: tetratricopeptide repeat protein [Candidatus Limnocylindria bacterium]|nr:tetratricopeptide repeat protein [Candidatus Limnocylindria bacterium]
MALVVLAIARALLTLVPAMTGWAFNLQRFLPPWAWLLWALAALALAPPIARRLVPPLARFGDWIARTPLAAGALAIAVMVGLVLLLPDQVRFVGDFLLRQGTADEALPPSTLFPQALPLDVLLHYRLPRAMADLGWADANGTARLLGAFEAACFAWLALRFARVNGLNGAPATAATTVVLFGGYLGMFTGFGKAFAEMCVIAAGIGVFGVEAVRTGRGLLPLGVCLAAGVTLHRSALAFVPAVMLAWAFWLGSHGRQGAWRRPDVLAAALVPVATLAVMIPKIVAVVRRFDAVHFAPAAVTRAGGVLPAAFAGARPYDLLSLIAMLSPLALAAPLLIVALGRAPARRREFWTLLALALPMLATMPFIHPVGGLVRDWDDFAALGVTLSLLTAWLIGEALRAAPVRAWVAAGVVLGAAMPTVQWLVHHTNVDFGLRRAEALMSEPPPRSPEERAATFDYIGQRNEGLGRFADAARAFGRAAETAPSPRILLLWGILESAAGNHAGAQQAFRRVTEKDSTQLAAWLGLAAASTRLRQYDEGRRAVERALAIDPRNQDGRSILRAIERAEAVTPER